MKREDRPLFGALITVALALLLNAILSFTEGSGQPQGQQTQTYADQSGPTEKPESESFWVRAVDDPINLFTGVLAIFTIILAGASIWQGRLTDCAIRKAEASSERQLRAYVYLDLGARPYPSAHPNRYSITLKMTNSGATWARKVRMRRKIIRNHPGDSDPFDELSVDQTEGDGAFLLGPRQSIEFQFGDIPYGGLHDIALGNETIHYIVWITYEDSLSDPPIMRHTQMYARLNADIEGGVSFTYRPSHNCADEDCA